MAASQNRAESVGVPQRLSAIVAGACLLIVIAIGLGLYRHFFSPSPGPPVAVRQTSRRDRDIMLEMARKCRGRFDQLSPTDQATVQQLSHGQGVGAIYDTAMENHIR